MRGGRRFGGVVIAHQGQYATVLCGAGQIGVAEDVAGAIDARALAVPHAEYALALAFAAQFGLLRTPDRSRGQVFVDTALKADIALLQEGSGALKLAVQAAKRRTAIAGNKTCGIKAVAAIQLFLRQTKANQRLKSRHKNSLLAEVVFVVEFDVVQRHTQASLPPSAKAHV